MIEHFSYNTNAAVPEKAGLQGVSGDDQGWKLEKMLKATCGKDLGKHFGFKNSNTCMKAWYTALYVTSFFAEKDKSKLKFDPGRDWAEGLEAQLGASASLAEAGSKDHDPLGLLQIPLRRHSSSYVEGFHIHLAGQW